MHACNLPTGRGGTACAGSTARLCYSLKYAPPEIIHALEAGRKTTQVSGAVDIWAVGVIAFELLTGERAFPQFTMSLTGADDAVQDAIAGRTQLPWEQPDAGPRLEKLRGLKRTVLRCLERKPSRRPTARNLLRSWEHAFDNMQAHGSDVSTGSI